MLGFFFIYCVYCTDNEVESIQKLNTLSSIRNIEMRLGFQNEILFTKIKLVFNPIRKGIISANYYKEDKVFVSIIIGDVVVHIA